MTYVLGAYSRRELRGVHPDLVAVVEDAIEISTQDFRVLDGLRSLAEQRRMVERGASKTLKSKHLLQPDGYGHAVDLVPLLNGKPRWEWELIYPIAEAMRTVARERNVAIRWGGTWARLDNTTGPIAELHEQSDGWDGPHYELLIS